MADHIAIPAAVREMPISNFILSMRLQNVLGWKECHMMGDLNGLRFSELARWRNCGKATLLELLGIVRCLQHANWDTHYKPYTRDTADDYEDGPENTADCWKLKAKSKSGNRESGKRKPT